MQNSNYVVLIDENGQPYLAHSIWDRAKSAYGSARSAAGKAYGSARSAGNRAVKYIEKIGDGAKARYFYTKDELQAYYDNMRGKAKDTAQQAKQKAQKVAERAKVEARYAVGSAQKEARDRAYDEMVRASRDAGRAQVQGATNTSAARQAQNDARKAHDAAHEARTRQIDEYVGARASDRAASRQLSRAAAAKEAADKNASRWITTRRDYDEATKANEAYERALDDRRRAASEKRMAKKEFDKVKRDDNKAYADYVVSQYNANKAELKESYDNRRAQEAAEAAKRRYDALKQEYADTPLAQLEKAADGIQNAVNSAKDKVTEVAETAKGKVAAAASEAKSAYDRMRDEFAKKRQAEAIKNNRKEKPTIGSGDKAEDAAFYQSPIMSRDKDINGNVRNATRIIQKEGAAITALNSAAQSLANATNVDDARRAASEKRMAENELSGLRGSFENWKSAETQKQAKENASSADRPKIDLSKLADNEYVYALGSNTGHAGEVKKVMDAESAYNTAMRNYNRITASKTASGQDKSAAKREMDRLKKEYEGLLNDLVDTLNNE